MRPVVIVTHLSDRQVGLVREALRASGCDVIERHAVTGDPLPAAGEIAGIVSLGLPRRLPVLKWHEDVIELPDDATVLGSSDGPGRRCSGSAPVPGAARPTWSSRRRCSSTAGWLIRRRPPM